jgi:hypothetical protein
LFGRLIRLGVEDRNLLAASDYQTAIGRGVFEPHPARPLDVKLSGRDRAVRIDLGKVCLKGRQAVEIVRQPVKWDLLGPGRKRDQKGERGQKGETAVHSGDIARMRAGCIPGRGAIARTCRWREAL